MEKGIRLFAPAKINLHLEVAGKREDGFHNILSLFQAVSLYDEITICSLKYGEKSKLKGAFSFSQYDNTITRAIDVFNKTADSDMSVSVEIKKQIPAAAGLGGGSSDAASVLFGLNRLAGEPLGREDILNAALSVGSDVPFFCAFNTAIVKGRGEILEPVPTREDLFLLLILPCISISSQQAYDLLDEYRGREAEVFSSLKTKDLYDQYLTLHPSKWGFFNSFFPAISEKYGILRSHVQMIKDLGADFSGMSGSGSTLFGIFTDLPVMRRACRFIREKNIEVLPIRFINSGKVEFFN